MVDGITFITLIFIKFSGNGTDLFFFYGCKESIRRVRDSAHYINVGGSTDSSQRRGDKVKRDLTLKLLFVFINFMTFFQLHRLYTVEGENVCK